jgi:hypothetical protein
MRMQAHMLPDGKRLRLHDGPIDLIIGADGASDQIRTAYRAAAQSRSLSFDGSEAVALSDSLAKLLLIADTAPLVNWVLD